MKTAVAKPNRARWNKDGADTVALRARGGFSLVEVLCALAILGVGLAGLTTALTTALRSARDSEGLTSAALLAAGRIEILRAEGYYIDGTSEGDCEDVLPGHQWRQTLSPTEIDGLHEVTVVIENPDSGLILYELKTLLFEAPLDSTESGRSREQEREHERPRQGTRR